MMVLFSYSSTVTCLDPFVWNQAPYLAAGACPSAVAARAQYHRMDAVRSNLYYISSKCAGASYDTRLKRHIAVCMSTTRIHPAGHLYIPSVSLGVFNPTATNMCHPSDPAGLLTFPSISLRPLRLHRRKGQSCGPMKGSL